ncbi:54S ribosomal protein L20, mitochondrial [Smittium mucronatum]|uniref:54S ribosomal protein L20, mitochondrial n=1 Tax=Smittium mucronatum TaxID=133383 RepID=A0A1R0H2F9_9FUNG|nr:54S ribosomal protein L20, mitochondrial [Smittium mucronatum]
MFRLFPKTINFKNINALPAHISRNYGKIAASETQNFVNELPSKSNKFKTKIYSSVKLEDNSIFEARIPLVPQTEPAVQITEADLPPLVSTKYADKKYEIMNSDQIAEIIKLRNTDPVHWTRSKLAVKFGCSEVFIGMIAKCPKWRLEQIQQENEAKWSKMGYKKRMIKINRIRRRMACCGLQPKLHGLLENVIWVNRHINESSVHCFGCSEPVPLKNQLPHGPGAADPSPHERHSSLTKRNIDIDFIHTNEASFIVHHESGHRWNPEREQPDQQCIEIFSEFGIAECSVHIQPIAEEFSGGGCHQCTFRSYQFPGSSSQHQIV